MVLNGIDRIDQYEKNFTGRRIGLITSSSGLTVDFKTTVEIFYKRFRLTALFAPEHGLRGDSGAGVHVEDAVDPKTGIPVYSLYRKDLRNLTEEMLSRVDMVVYDIQDVGSRYYTYLYTMLYAMESCSKAGKAFAVLDRPNPLGGEIVEGNTVKESYLSFVGGYPLCMRYGLTIGEFAIMADRTLSLGADLHIIPCEGWKRSMLWPETGRPWVKTSPSLIRFDSALLYSGTCLFEGTNLSEGRGTPAPFEIVGAPYIKDPDSLADSMNKKKLPGVLFRPLRFTPDASKYRGVECGGVRMRITDRNEIRPVSLAVTLLYEIKSLWPGNFDWCTPLPPATRPHIDLLGGDGQLLSNRPLEALLESYRRDSEAFGAAKRAYHLYE